MPEPDTPDARGGDREGLLAEFIGHAYLPSRRLGNRHLHNGLFDLRRHTILQQRFLAGDLLEGGLTAGLIEFLEAIEAISAIAHRLARLRHIAELLG